VKLKVPAAAPAPAAPPPAAPAASAPAPVAPASAPVAPPPQAPSAAAPAAAPATDGKVHVLIGSENEEYRQMIRSVIESQTDYRIDESPDGDDTWQRLLAGRPAVLVADVALPGLYGFEVAEKVRAEPAIAGTKIILIASVYDKTRYKRRPSQLYGADDYVEKHHIPDLLVPKINNLLLDVHGTGKSAPSPTAPEPWFSAEAIETPQMNDSQRDAMLAAEPSVPAGDQSGDNEKVEKARRLARIIVSDIALYNQDLIEEGIREGNLDEKLANEVAEAREVFAQRVEESVRQQSDFLGEELRRLIESKKAEVGGA
ncbi:MAG: response regulator, partial [Chrysiogenetes bacterium]|nr:response regulator [Chrysiogenetes bacterium]